MRYLPLTTISGTPLEDVATITYASYYYDGDPNRINRNQIVPGGKCNAQFPGDPDALRKCVEDKTQILAKKPDGTLVMVNPVEYKAAREAGSIEVVDAVEAVRRYIAETAIEVRNLDGVLIHTALGLGGDVEAADMPFFPRYNLLSQLVDSTIEFGLPAIEPFRGAPPPGFVYPADYISGVADTPDDEGKF